MGQKSNCGHSGKCVPPTPTNGFQVHKRLRPGAPLHTSPLQLSLDSGAPSHCKLEGTSFKPGTGQPLHLTNISR
eukprot:1137505-Pelagomonas_calceolata.AAC.3